MWGAVCSVRTACPLSSRMAGLWLTIGRLARVVRDGVSNGGAGTRASYLVAALHRVDCTVDFFFPVLPVYQRLCARGRN